MSHRFWTDDLLALVPLQTRYSVLLLCTVLYLGGIVLAIYSRIVVSLPAFVLSERSFAIAIVGIGESFLMANYLANHLRDALEDSSDCFEVSRRKFNRLVTKLTTWSSKTGSALFALAAIGSLMLLVWYSYPVPLFRAAAGYVLYDWYVLAVFVVVMAIIGSAGWTVISVIRELSEIRTMPVKLERIKDLQPLIRIVLIFVAAWFLGTGLVYLALPLAYTIATTAVGYLAFFLSQLYVHDAIVLKKKETIRRLQQKYEIAQDNLEDPSNGERAQLTAAILMLTTWNMLRDIDGNREWPISYPQFFNLVLSSLIPIVIRYAITATV